MKICPIRHYAATVFTAAATALSCACSDTDGGQCYAGRLRTASADSDSLVYLLQQLDADRAGAECLLEQTVDSAAEVRAVAIVAAMPPKQAAAYLLANPSRSLITQVWHTYMMLPDHSKASEMSTALLQGFRAMAAGEQAVFLVSVATAAECGTYIEDGDEELVKALRREYASTPDTLAAFECAYRFRQHTR